MKTIPKGLKTRNDELNRLTKESITQALMLLLKDEAYEKISITDICNKAGVSRNAFYKNFGNKENVFHKIVRDFNKSEILAKIGNPFNKKAGIEWYVNCFSVLKENHHVFEIFINSGFRKLYLDYMNQLLTDSPKIDVKTKYERLIWYGGLQNAAVEWFASGMSKTPKEMAIICYKAFHCE